MNAEFFGRKGRPADAVKSVTPGDEITRNLVTSAGLLVRNPGVFFEIMDAHGLRFEKDGRVVPAARGDQILEHFLLRIDGNRLPYQVLKIDAVTLAGKPQFHAVMNEAFSPHTLTDAGTAQEIYGTLLQHTGAHARLHILARVAFEHHGLNAL